MKMSNTITNFIKAFNDHDTNILLGFLSDDAVINDEGHDYRGIPEIRKWYDEKAVAPSVTLKPIRAVEMNPITIVTAKVDGNFDKTGLPNPLELDFHFTIDANRVSRLSIHFPETRKTYLNALKVWLI